jgi:hypothetical protein
MQMRNHTVRLSYWIAIVLLFEALFIRSSGPPLLHAAGHSEAPAFSLDVRGAPLGEVLKKISDDTGYQITVDSEWAGWPVSGSFKNLPVNLGLRRILSNLNHSIVFNDADHRIAIVIKASPDDETPKAGAAPIAVNRHPPGESNPREAPSGDLTRPRDKSAVPPEEPEQTGKTQSQAKEPPGHQPKVDPDDREGAPPGEPARKAVASKDIRAPNSLPPAAVSKNPQLVPPEESGSN